MEINFYIYIIVILAVVCLGGVIGFLIRKRFSEAKLGSADEAARRVIEEAKKKAEMIEKEALLKAKEKVLSGEDGI